MSNIGRKYTDTDMQLFHCDSVTCSGVQEWMGEERSGPSDQPARLMEELWREREEVRLQGALGYWEGQK